MVEERWGLDHLPSVSLLGAFGYQSRLNPGLGRETW
jgi:hypothetical protein